MVRGVEAPRADRLTLAVLAEPAPEARYVVCRCVDWSGAIDMADTLHPQTLVTSAMNGGDLPVAHGGPLRLRVPRQLGYKRLKYLTCLTVTDSLEGTLPDEGGNYSWYARI